MRTNSKLKNYYIKTTKKNQKNNRILQINREVEYIAQIVRKCCKNEIEITYLYFCKTKTL